MGIYYSFSGIKKIIDYKFCRRTLRIQHVELLREILKVTKGDVLKLKDLLTTKYPNQLQYYRALDTVFGIDFR